MRQTTTWMRWWILAAALTPLTPLSAAQFPRTVAVSSTPACAACTIELTRIATLGRATDSELLGRHSFDVAPDGRGRFVTAGGSLDRLLVYDSAGALVRVFGRRGQGPGEFTTIFALRGIGDSLHLLDGGQPLRVLSPTLDVVRSIHTPPGFDLRRAAFLRSGEVLTQTSPTQVQLLRPDGRLIRSIAVPAPGGDRQCPACERRWLAPAREAGRFWSTVSNRYEIDQFDVEGRHHLRLVRRSSWFEPWRDHSLAVPNPRAGVIREDADGMLWVGVLVPDPAPTPLTSEDSTQTLNPVILGRMYDTIIEVIDPRSGRLIASRRLPDTFEFVGRDLLVTSTENDDGIVTMDVWRVALRRR